MITLNPKRQVWTISLVAQCDPIMVNLVPTLSTFVSLCLCVAGWKFSFFFIAVCVQEGVSAAHLGHKGHYCIVANEKSMEQGCGAVQQ